ncbi:MAG TPA: hypothetical protein DD437_05645 [Rhodobiaceae bacterium]|nr:hypothetical protein [Rhodobiaceae bacterium]
MPSDTFSFVVARWGLLLVTLASLGAIFLRAQSDDILSIDLVHLLPSSDRSPDIVLVVKERREQFERRLLILAGAEEAEQAFAAAKVVVQTLEGVPQLSVRSLSSAPAGRDIYSFYAQHRHGLLDVDMARLLRRGDAVEISTLVARRYADPSTLLNSALIKSDPLLLLPAFLDHGFSTSSENMRFKDGSPFFEEGGWAYVPVSFDLAGSPFSIDVQRGVTAALADAIRVLREKMPEAVILSAGVVRHAANGTQTAEAEISTVGLGSLVGVVLLVLFVFRSSLPLGASILSIGVGGIAGFTACLFVFGNVHLLTLVFGGSLVGISVDYVFHYFCERARRDEEVSGEEARARVFAGITLGLVTTLIGFIGMWIAPFPGLRQMALFSGVGLVGSYLMVCLWFPVLSQGLRPIASGPADAVQRYLIFWQKLPRSAVAVTAAGVGLLALVGVAVLEPQDDVRLFQSLDGELLAEQQQIETALDERTVSQFFLVEGRSSEELLQRVEMLSAGLTEAAGEEGMTLSSLLPSIARQQENRALLVSYLEADGTIEVLQSLVGLQPKVLDDYVNSLKAAPASLGLQEWLADPVSSPYRQLYLGEREGAHRAVVTLARVLDREALERLASENPGVAFIDTAGTYSRLFSLYREQVSILALFSYVLVTALLLWRYGVTGTLAIMAAPIFAAFVSFGVLGLVWGTYSLFNVMALILVLGISVDYGIFFREAGPDSATTLMAVVLSALTTILAFGLLAFSSTAAIQAFGVTIFVGIVVSLLVSPIAGVSLRGRG